MDLLDDCRHAFLSGEDIEAATPASGIRIVDVDHLASARREMFDRDVGAAVSPGNRIELFDGLHSCEDLAGALTAFRGHLDLAMCTSTFAATRISAINNGCYHVIHAPRQQDVTLAALELGVAIRAHCNGIDYVQARLHAARVIVEQVDPSYLERA